MSIIGFLIGFLHILAYGGLLLLVGLLIKWFIDMWRPLPPQATNLWIGIVGAVCLALLVGLLVGYPVPSPLRL